MFFLGSEEEGEDIEDNQENEVLSSEEKNSTDATGADFHELLGRERRHDVTVPGFMCDTCSCVPDTGEEDMEDQDEQQPEPNPDCSKGILKVTCGALSGSLNKTRFASGNYTSLNKTLFIKFHTLQFCCQKCSDEQCKCAPIDLLSFIRQMWEKYSHRDELVDPRGVCEGSIGS